MKNTFSIDRVAVRLVKDAIDYTSKKLKNSADVVQFLGNKMKEFDREVMCVINVSASGFPINYTFASLGALNATLTEPRELMKASILSNSAGIILMHNHPGGSLSPSAEDCLVTDKMIKVGDLLGIPLLDHIIVSPSKDMYFSFKEKRMISHEEYEKVSLQDIQFSEPKVAEVDCEYQKKVNM